MAVEDDDKDALVDALKDDTAPAGGWTGGDPTHSSSGAPRVTQNAQGGWQLQEHGNTRALVGDEVGNAQNYAKQFWQDNPTGFQGGAKSEDSLKDAYQQFTGRTADAAGLAAHMKNPGGFEGAINAIAGSPEARAYQANHPITQTMSAPAPGAAAGAAPAAGAAGAAPAAGAPGAVQPSIFQGFTPKYAMEGFDFNREQNTGKSAKDAFAYLAQQAPPPPLNDKAALQAWTEKYIVPGMNQLGHNVSGVQGDKFHLKNWQGDFDVDYGRGAGAEGGALAWQVDDPTAKLSNQAYVPRAAGQTNAATNPALTNAISGGGGQAPSSQDQLKQEIEALIAGGATPSEVQALQAQLTR